VSKAIPPRVTTETPIGPDVDLEREDIRLSNDKRLTQEIVEEIVERVHRSGGRPSLSGEPMHSPQITFRVPPEIRRRAAEVAASEGKTVSQLAREALEARLAG
jgi:predicted HicB family RNase H-like nuclease